MFIAVYLKNELEADKFHQNINSIYRVDSELRSKNYPLTAAPMSDWLKNGFPGITESARMFSPFYKNQSYVTVGEQSFEINKPVFVDPSFFNIFSFPIKYGYITDDFDTRNSVVLTEPLAMKLFGNKDPVGKTVRYCGKNELTVMAVLKTLPSNSSMDFELLLPFASFNDYNSFDLTSWDRLTYQTFVVANKNPDILSIQVNQKIKEQFPEKEFTYSLIPLKDIHFSSNADYDNIFRHESKSSVYIFLIVAIAILLIAIINFLNLTVATSSLRVKENMIRRIEGANGMQLSLQYVLEAVLISLTASVIAIVFIELLFPVFNNLLDSPQNQVQTRQPWFFISMGTISLVTGILSGTYPAVKFSRAAKNASLNTKTFLKTGEGKWSNLLLVFQFTTSIVLIVATMFIVKQMNFIQTQKLGFNKEEVMYLRLTDDIIQQRDAVLNKLKNTPGVVSVNTCDFVPGQAYSQRILSVDVNGEKVSHQVYHTKVSEEYLKTLNLEIVKGRDFYQGSPADQYNFIVNETFVKEYGLGNPLGTIVDGGKIIGVVKDFNFNSLHQPVGPMTIRLTDGNQTTMMIRTDVPSGLKGISTLMATIKNQITEVVPGAFVEIKFLNDQIQHQYIKEKKAQKLLGYFSFFAIFISGMGLFGLVIFTLNQRIKEIGIRKVNGAKVYEVMIMLNKDFVKWVAIAFVIATPIAYYAMTKWLENFAYKTNLSWWIFALAGLMALGIALFTVSWQIWKAATRNPVEALRHE
jgi:putative ABC transport system permease protein